LIALPEHTILLSPIGGLDIGLFEPIISGISDIFGFHAKTKSLIDDVGFALDPERRQHHSTTILDKLADLAPSDSLKVIAITDVDLFIPILTHVYGEAQLGGRACIISICRLNEGISIINNRDAYICRVVKEAAHELGHTFNLRHCKEHTCIMHYCRSIKDVDGKSDQLCRYCKVLLSDEMKRLDKKKQAKS
jgi:archaemetzincin